MASTKCSRCQIIRRPVGGCGAQTNVVAIIIYDYRVVVLEGLLALAKRGSSQVGVWKVDPQADVVGF